ncbi:polynucleotide adenylyltransferase, partial [Cystoisospora suis]
FFSVQEDTTVKEPEVGPQREEERREKKEKDHNEKKDGEKKQEEEEGQGDKDRNIPSKIEKGKENEGDLSAFSHGVHASKDSTSLEDLPRGVVEARIQSRRNIRRTRCFFSLIHRIRRTTPRSRSPSCLLNLSSSSSSFSFHSLSHVYPSSSFSPCDSLDFFREDEEQTAYFSDSALPHSLRSYGSSLFARCCLSSQFSDPTSSSSLYTSTGDMSSPSSSFLSSSASSHGEYERREERSANSLQRRRGERRRRVVPLVRSVEVDISFSHEVCLHNTRLLRTYSGCFGEEIQLLFRLVKHWAKQRKINDAYRGLLSSYAWLLLCIFHLQHTLSHSSSSSSSPLIPQFVGSSSLLQGTWPSLRYLYEALENPSVLPLLPNLQKPSPQAILLQKTFFASPEKMNSPKNSSRNSPPPSSSSTLIPSSSTMGTADTLQSETPSSSSCSKIISQTIDSSSSSLVKKDGVKGGERDGEKRSDEEKKAEILPSDDMKTPSKHASLELTLEISKAAGYDVSLEDGVFVDDAYHNVRFFHPILGWNVRLSSTAMIPRRQILLQRSKRDDEKESEGGGSATFPDKEEGRREAKGTKEKEEEEKKVKSVTDAEGGGCVGKTSFSWPEEDLSLTDEDYARRVLSSNQTCYSSSFSFSASPPLHFFSALSCRFPPSSKGRRTDAEAFSRRSKEDEEEVRCIGGDLYLTPSEMSHFIEVRYHLLNDSKPRDLLLLPLLQSPPPGQLSLQRLQWPVSYRQLDDLLINSKFKTWRDCLHRRYLTTLSSWCLLNPSSSSLHSMVQGGRSPFQTEKDVERRKQERERNDKKISRKDGTPLQGMYDDDEERRHLHVRVEKKEKKDQQKEAINPKNCLSLVDLVESFFRYYTLQFNAFQDIIDIRRLPLPPLAKTEYFSIPLPSAAELSRGANTCATRSSTEEQKREKKRLKAKRKRERKRAKELASLRARNGDQDTLTTAWMNPEKRQQEGEEEKDIDDEEEETMEAGETDEET